MPSHRQMEAFVDFLERNPELTKGQMQTQQGRLVTRRKWQEFATADNAMGGTIKDGSAWAKQTDDCERLDPINRSQRVSRTRPAASSP